MEAKSVADDRFYTPRSSARRGYTSGGSEDERFVSPRESARSVSSDDNEYGTPRESLPTPAPVQAEQHAHSAKYLDEAFRSSKRVPLGSELKQAPLLDDAKYEHKVQRNGSAAEHYLGLATAGSARGSELHVAALYADAPAAPENDVFSATRHNRVDSVTYMLDQGVSVNAKDEFGNTILSIACQNGLKRMAKLALRRGANINSRNLRGNTALHFCFAYGFGDTLGAYLISKGADTTIENKDGRVCYYDKSMGCARLVVGDDHRDCDRDDGSDGDDAPSLVHTSYAATNAEYKRDGGSDDGNLSDDTDMEEEMMRIDPGDIEWRRQLHVGDPVDAQNVFGNWCPAMILRMVDGELQIRFLNMNDAWHRWIPSDSGQLAQPATKTRNDSFPVRLAQQIEVRKTVHGVWKEAHVVRARPSDVRVRYAGRQQQFDEWIPFSPDTVAPLGEHTRHRSFAAQRQLSVAPKHAHHRVFETRNPRFQHYREALERHGLRICPIDGDGNCLFRSVSHQVYGDDRHHAAVRAMCMDYMESEKEYFEPYVVGDMAAFVRYLNYKRRAGVWGDDPELQAMCELYDRPAEVYAYDPAHGFRKLRTFHESSGVSRSRPPIRLSYYGGGHYDSLVGLDHAANCIRDAPGEWERRHIEYSRRINTRDRDDAADADVALEVAAESDRETTEMAQLEQMLLLSRTEFDGMDSSLDDTLKLSLEEYERSGGAEAAASGGAGAGDVAVEREQQELRDATRESEMAAIQADLIAKVKQASEEEMVKKAIEASLQALPPGAHDADFDEQVSAAIQASLGHLGQREAAAAEAAPPLVGVDDYDEQVRRALELSAHEFHAAVAPAAAADFADTNDEDDELQRAIQASLQQS